MALLPNLQTFLLKDTQRSYKWKVSFMDPMNKNKTGGFKEFLFGAVDDFLGSISSEVRENKVVLHPFTVQSITLPSYDIEQDIVPVKGTQRKRPASATISGATLSFYETGDGEVTQALEQWRRLVYNPDTNTFGLPAEYEADIVVSLTTSFNIVHTTFTLKRCWPITNEPIQLVHDGGGSPLLIGQSFSVDRMEINTKGLLEVLMGGDISDLNIPNVTGNVPRLGGLIF